MPLGDDLEESFRVALLGGIGFTVSLLSLIFLLG